MTAPIDEDAEAPLRLQPVVARPQGWRGRTAGIVAVGLVSFVVLGIVLGTASDRSPVSSAAAVAGSPTAAPSSALPSRRPTPNPEPLPTPLPTMEIVGGHIPNERRLVYASGPQVLDLATGTLVSPARPYEDFMLPLTDDQLVCACLVHGGVAGADGTVSSPGLRFGRYDLAGETIVERDLVTFDDAVPVGDMTEGVNVVVALDATRRNLLVLAMVRRPPVWDVELLVVDAMSGKVIADTTLDSLPVDLEEPRPSASPPPGGGPPDGVYAWANWLAPSPDGRVLYASISFSEVRGENWTNGNREWMVPLRGGTPGTPRQLSLAATLKSDGWCLGRPSFVDPELMIQVCTPAGGEDPGSSYYVRRVTATGESLGDLAIPAQPRSGYFPATAIIDRANRAVFLWEPGQHALTRIAIDDGGVEIGAVPRSSLPGDNPTGSGSYLGADPGLVVSLDGRRLYALGLRAGPGPAGTTTGVWVFDATTLALVDHWEARAFLTSLAVSADGQFVYAAAAPGFDVEGRENPWPASVTVYDAASGEIQVVYGAVSLDSWVNFPTWP